MVERICLGEGEEGLYTFSRDVFALVEMVEVCLVHAMIGMFVRSGVALSSKLTGDVLKQRVDTTL